MVHFEVTADTVGEQTFRSKPQLAWEMIGRARENGVKYGWVGFDAFYGSVPWLLRAVADSGDTFVADVRSNANFYLEDPAPYRPRRRSAGRLTPQALQARTEASTVGDFFAGAGAAQWRRVEIREADKGVIRVDACARRVWFWDGQEKQAHCWWAVCVIDEASGDTKFFVSNAAEDTSLEELVRKHAVRFWIERGFQDAKTSLGMADYQARGWPAWHHHMAMIMLAMLFLLRERRLHLTQIELLSCQDIVELLNVLLPRRDASPEAIITQMEIRHRKRKASILSARRSSLRRYRERTGVKSVPSVLTM